MVICSIASALFSSPCVSSCATWRNRHLLGSKDDAGEDGDGPDPLDAKGDPVGPLVRSLYRAFVDGCCEELAYSRRMPMLVDLLQE